MGLKGKLINLKIIQQEYGGKAVGWYQGKRVVTNQGIVGQLVTAKIKRIRQHSVEAETQEVLKKSPLETETACSHFDQCGGCSMQGVSYNTQVAMKEEQVRDLFELNKINSGIWLPTLQSPRVYEYRNKMEFSFGDQCKGGTLTLGMHQRGRRFDVVDTPDCNIIDEDFRLIRTITVRYFREKGIKHYHRMTHDGILRHLVIRKAAFTGEILVNLVTAGMPGLPVEEWKKALLMLQTQGKITGILWTRNDGVADTVQCDSLQLLYGKSTLSEKMLGLRFSITPFSFFQTNSFAAELLYKSVIELMEPSDQTVADLYCGLGTISQLLARKASSVTGIELIDEAVSQARIDALKNGIENCLFIAGDVKEVLSALPAKPDLIVVDPPRPGVNPKAMEELLKLAPGTFIYVSCNPKTLVENVKQALAAGWEIGTKRCVDLFPHTPHLEMVVTLHKAVQ
ncbi:MAG: 23S rRNA (uracil(1939)-C(5))-methyltransferase RlmD [Bacillota bacterium]|nr:23S rRNA (uracil(1939)-C(5))-methyltransferase RlmD [Bacillota bacterium]